MSGAFPYIRVEGGALDRGRQYGAAARDRIRAGLAIYTPAFKARGLEWNDVRRLSTAFAERIEGYSPELLRELQGIGEGADLPVEDIIVLNARTELLYGGQNDVALLDEGCTGAIVLPQRTAGGHLLHGQNWDWRAECLQSTIVLHVVPDSGREILTLVEAGGLARCGLNDAGVAITGNFLKCEHDDGRAGMPLSLVRRRVLESDNFVEAATVVLETPISFSNNLMVSWAPGVAMNWERTPLDAFWLEPEDGVLVHSNHFISTAARARVRDLGLLTSPDSLYRNRRVEAAIEEAGATVDVDTLKRAFADRFGSPHSVCRPPTKGGVGGAEVATVATVIMDVAAGELHVAAAPYDGADYQVHKLERAG